MAITLESISFNHDPNSATNDALTIRRNRFEDVAVPEWRRGMIGPEESRAAYIVSRIMANTLTIKATFRRQAGDDTSVHVSAIGMTGEDRGHVLGDVKAKTIHFGNDDVVTAELNLDSPQTNPGVGRWDISWIWSLGTGPNQTTKHRIYTTLDRPKKPWGQPGSLSQLPWTEVLDHACTRAHGALTLDDAATRLTRWVYSLGDTRLQYDNANAGSSSFIVPGTNGFNCTRFLQVLNNANGNGDRENVNCSDCATILSCFANILGCELWQSEIGYEFETHPIDLIGRNPGVRRFSYHEVAWKFPRDVKPPTLFDCCLEVDGDGPPSDGANFVPTLGTNLPLGVRGGDGYQGLLISSPEGNNYPEEQPLTRIQRRIDDGGTLALRPLAPARLDRLAEQHDFPAWNGSSTPKPNCKSPYMDDVTAARNATTSDSALVLKNFSFTEGSVVGWKPGEVKVYKVEPDPHRITEVVWYPSDGRKAALRVLTYECSSLPSARSFLLALLAQFNLPEIKRRLDFIVNYKPVKIGDVSFAGPDDLVLLFARASNVVFIQNVGPKPVPAAHLGHELDKNMVGEEIRIQTEAESAMKIECHKPDKKEQTIMTATIDITGVWSSRRPTLNGTGSADLSLDGVIEIKHVDLNTTAVTGFYRNRRELSPTYVLTGNVIFQDSRFTISLWHPLGEGSSRYYEGELVANDGRVQIVAGTWREVVPPEDNEAVAGSTATISATVANGQANGTWVATKP